MQADGQNTSARLAVVGSFLAVEVRPSMPGFSPFTDRIPCPVIRCALDEVLTRARRELPGD
jgi:hypothetical protein